MTRSRFGGVLMLGACTLIVTGVDLLAADTASGVVHAEAVDPGPGELSWAPPELTDPITVFVGADDVVGMDDGQDYRVVFPSTPVDHGVVLSGGRNVVIVGGEISIPWQGDDPPIYKRRALLIRGQTGVVHIEGLLITGEDVSEGINIDAPDAIVQLQNVRIENLHARDQVNFSDNHPDVIQAWGGVGELRVDRLTGETDYQGIFLKEDFGPIGPITLRRVNLVGLPTARYLFWNADNFDVAVDAVWAKPGANPWERTLWPSLDAWPGVNQGLPPDGDFVAPGSAGIGYEQWPYAGANDPGSNLPPTVTASAPASVELGTSVLLDGSVSDDGLPGPYSVQWLQASGPGVALFTDAAAANTTASFSVAGVYELSLTADDGELRGDSTVTIIVDPPTLPVNQAPLVIAAAPASVELGAGGLLRGSVVDDGLPGLYTVRWRQLSGPGLSSFADASSLDTEVTFDTAGVYEVQLTADDGELTGSSEVTVTVLEPPPTDPVQVTTVFSGSLNKKWPVRSFETAMAEWGPVTATVTVEGGRQKKEQSAELLLVLYDQNGVPIASVSGSDEVQLTAVLTAGVYTWEVSGARASFTLEVVYLL